jgi:hypothetical protein
MNTQSSHNGSFLIQNSENLINNFIRVTGNLTGSLCLPNQGLDSQNFVSP